MATTILKPGGYQRLSQIGALLMDCGSAPFAGRGRAAVVTPWPTECPSSPSYRKPIKPLPSRKIGRQVPLMDCFDAPCRTGCPIEQDIPAYLMRAGQGKYAGGPGDHPPPQRPALHHRHHLPPPLRGQVHAQLLRGAPWTSGA